MILFLWLRALLCIDLWIIFFVVCRLKFEYIVIKFRRGFFPRVFRRGTLRGQPRYWECFRIFLLQHHLTRSSLIFHYIITLINTCIRFMIFFFRINCLTFLFHINFIIRFQTTLITIEIQTHSSQKYTLFIYQFFLEIIKVCKNHTISIFTFIIILIPQSKNVWMFRPSKILNPAAMNLKATQSRYFSSISKIRKLSSRF